MFLELRWSDGSYVFASIIICLLTIGLVFLIYRSIKKESKKFKEESINYIEGLLQKAELVSDVAAYISRSSVVEFSLIYIDIDKFTNVISAFGKEESDKILEKVAYALLDNLPARIELARIQDDKFVAFARGEYGQDEVEDIAKKLLEVINKPIKIFGDSDINITASIGISFYPMHGMNYKDLISNAEIALYMCKRDGGNQYKIYSMENMNESANLEYYHQIKKGIKNKEFCLYYQPMIDCKNKTVYAVEGLLRWNHPEHGLLSPFKFINIMEQSGDINWVGLWGLEALMKEAELLNKKFPSMNIMMSMNLSPKQLINPNIIGDFQKILKGTRVLSKNIILEIEEFALFEKHEGIKQNIENLSKLGFKIAVDGFSLDYGTLTKLAALPIDIIKVDNDFLDPENDTFLKDKFVDMLVDYTNNESKILIAEGIEDNKMLHKAVEMNLCKMQGYYFAKPMSATELETYIKSDDWINKIDESSTTNTVEEEIKEELAEIKEEEKIEEAKEQAKETSSEVEETKENQPIEEKNSTEETEVESKPVEEEKPQEKKTPAKKTTASTTKKAPAKKAATSSTTKKTSSSTAKKATTSTVKKTTSPKKVEVKEEKKEETETK